MHIGRMRVKKGQRAEMRGQSQDELERITKIRRIKNYKEMSKEELIIFLLK